jgi:CBS domain containing-hemolysin-like protein
VETVLRLLAVAGLVLANGFFVAAEFALVSVRRTRVEEMIAQGNRTAAVVRRAIQDPDRFIAATQLGITVASLLLGWIGEKALLPLLEPLFRLLPDSWIGTAHVSITVAISFVIITFLHVVIGELAPKSIALQNPERTSLLVARPILWSFYLFRPFIWVLNGAGNLFLRLLRVPPASAHQRVHSVQELKMLLDDSRRGGVLEEEEQRMLVSVFDLGDLTAHQVMIPRPDMDTVAADDPVRELVERFRATGHSRFPVLGPGGVDDVAGVVSVKDLLLDLHGGAVDLERPVRELMRPALFFPETKPVADLLRELRQDRTPMAILVDEYGGVAGALTVEDIVEEIIGELRGELGREPSLLQPVDGRTLVFSGQMRLEEANEEWALNLPESEAYETVAGFILTHLQRLPTEGEAFRYRDMRIRVLTMRGPRIEQVEITRLPESAGPAASGPGK